MAQTNKQFLSKVLKELTKKLYPLHPFINSGGCGKFAEILYNCLAETIGVEDIKPVIVSYWIYELTPKAYEKCSKENWTDSAVESNMPSFPHIGLDYKGMFLDCRCNGDIYDFTGKYFIRIQDLHEINQCGKGWNKTFNIKELPDIKRQTEAIVYNLYYF